MRILLIEPDALLGKTYTKALEVVGHTVDSVRNAQSAIIAADDHLPDLVILELQLPSHNGIAFLQEFRSYHDWSDIPVIFHTFAPPHSQDSAEAIVAKQYGVTAWLYKPQTTLPQLLSVVHRHSVGAA
jgi:DNA-binding response OmpR family regulator